MRIRRGEGRGTPSCRTDLYIAGSPAPNQKGGKSTDRRGPVAEGRPV